jgi:hypothetical protein
VERIRVLRFVRKYLFIKVFCLIEAPGLMVGNGCLKKLFNGMRRHWFQIISIVGVGMRYIDGRRR